MLIEVKLPVTRAVVPGGRSSRSVKLSLALLEFRQLAITGGIKPTGTNKFHNPLQFIPIKPGAVILANIDDHVRVTREIDPVH